jgi:hypothetical protein
VAYGAAGISPAPQKSIPAAISDSEGRFPLALCRLRSFPYVVAALLKELRSTADGAQESAETTDERPTMPATRLQHGKK